MVFWKFDFVTFMHVQYIWLPFSLIHLKTVKKNALQKNERECLLLFYFDSASGYKSSRPGFN